MCVGTALGLTGAAATAANLSAISTAVSLVGSVMQYSAQQDAADAAAKQAEYNATIAEVNAMEARERGGIEANEKRQEVKRMLAAQNTQMAANGGETSSGTALNLFGDTAYQGAKDAKTIELNALREAYGYESQARSTRINGSTTASNYRAQSYGSLLTGASSAFKSGSELYALKK